MSRRLTTTETITVLIPSSTANPWEDDTDRLPVSVMVPPDAITVSCLRLTFTNSVNLTSSLSLCNGKIFPRKIN